MKLKNNWYDTLKWLLTIVVPALVTLIIGFGELYNFDTVTITGTITLLATFLGGIFMLSSTNYKK